jgi:putative SOS response-associated peptidase YedK
MCGRFTLSTPRDVVARHFGVDDLPGYAPRFNIAPTQETWIVRARSARDARRVAELRRFGLVPAWSRDPRTGARFINARIETASERPAFRGALQWRRCGVPADGFYEWRRSARGSDPFLFRRPDAAPFALAGLFETWLGPGGEIVESFAVLTTQAQEPVAAVHDRMPVILRAEHLEGWLAPRPLRPEELAAVAAPPSAPVLVSFAVDRHVNDPRHDDARCVAPV